MLFNSSSIESIGVSQISLNIYLTSNTLRPGVYNVVPAKHT